MRLIVRQAAETEIVAAAGIVVGGQYLFPVQHRRRHQVGAQQMRTVPEVGIVLDQTRGDAAYMRRRHAAAAHVPVYWLVVPALAEVTTDPVATRLGFMRPSPVGPKLLFPASSPTWFEVLS